MTDNRSAPARAERASQAPASRRGTSARPAQGHFANRVLVVGGDPRTIRVLDESKAGGQPSDEHRVLLASDLTTIAGLALGTDLDLALVAVDLPGGSAAEMIHLLRSSTRAVVLATGTPADADQLLAAVEAGAHDFLFTPLRPEDLHLRVRAARARELEIEGPASAVTGGSTISGSPFGLIHDLNNVLGAMRTTTFLSMPPPASVFEPERPPRLGPEESAVRMDRLVTRASELLAELHQRLTSLS